MDIEVKPGVYVVAVSGGVDSVVLLDLFIRTYKDGPYMWVVAHFDHSIREDSAADAVFVEKLAATYDLPFELGRAQLGPNASEALAREKRYEFLRAVQKKHGAKAIITAHHQDDVLETAIINTLRGTKRRGLTSLTSQEIIRPLLKFSKQEILHYANDHNLEWREDATNQDTKYLRNKVRKLLKNAPDNDKLSAHELLQKISSQNHEIDTEVQKLLTEAIKNNSIDRSWFLGLSFDEASEIMATWLRRNKAVFDKAVVQRLVLQARTAQNGTKHDVDKAFQIVISGKRISLLEKRSV